MFILLIFFLFIFHRSISTQTKSFQYTCNDNQQKNNPCQYSSDFTEQCDYFTVDRLETKNSVWAPGTGEANPNLYFAIGCWSTFQFCLNQQPPSCAYSSCTLPSNRQYRPTTFPTSRLTCTYKASGISKDNANVPCGSKWLDLNVTYTCHNTLTTTTNPPVPSTTTTSATTSATTSTSTSDTTPGGSPQTTPQNAQPTNTARPTDPTTTRSNSSQLPDRSQSTTAPSNSASESAPNLSVTTIIVIIIGLLALCYSIGFYAYKRYSAKNEEEEDLPHVRPLLNDAGANRHDWGGYKPPLEVLRAQSEKDLLDAQAERKEPERKEPERPHVAAVEFDDGPNTIASPGKTTREPPQEPWKQPQLSEETQEWFCTRGHGNMRGFFCAMCGERRPVIPTPDDFKAYGLQMEGRGSSTSSGLEYGTEV